MTIEYTYPEQKPNGASIDGIYFVKVASVPGWIAPPASNIEARYVPEVCEAMMRLAGHGPISWDTSVKEMGAREAAERIIARLETAKEKRDEGDNSVSFSNRRWAFADAMSIVREECGLQ